MQKVSRSIFAGLLVIAGLTACGDKVTVAGGPTSTAATPVVHSVTVQPSSVTLKVGETVKLVATVDADATLARTVTWASGDAGKASVGADGTVTAVAPGTVAITATSTADPTVAGAATIIVQTVTAATISIGQINQTVGNASVPADLANVSGQLNVTLNVDQGTQTITELDLLVKNITTSKVDTVARYFFAAANKAPVSATSAPITMSFNTAKYNDTTGAVNFVNGQYTIQAQAVVAGSTGQSPVSSTMQYTLNNTDFMTVSAHGDTNAVDHTGRQWTAGQITVTAVPVLYSGKGLLSATFTNPDSVGIATAQGHTTVAGPFPASVKFTTDTVTDSLYVASVTAKYSDATQFNGGVAVLANKLRVDNQAPLRATTFALGGTTEGVGGNTLLVPWVNGVYAFSKGLSKVVDTNTAAVYAGVGGVTTKFYTLPSADTLLNNATATPHSGSGAACTVPTNAVMAATGAAITQQSAPGDTTTYIGLAVSTDALGNVVCQNMIYSNTAANVVSVYGVDNTAPVNAALADSAMDGNFGLTPLSVGNSWHYVLQDSISGFSATPISATLIWNYRVTNDATTCTIGTYAAGPPATCKAIAIAQNTAVDNGLGSLGYYTMTSTISDNAGNTVVVPPATVLIDNAAPTQAATQPTVPNGVGDSTVVYTGNVLDETDLISGIGAIQYPSYALSYPSSLAPAHAAFSGTRDTTGVVTLTVANHFISSLQVTSAGDAPQTQGLAAGHPTGVLLKGVDGVGNKGGATLVPTVTDNVATAENWAPSMFATFLESNTLVHSGATLTAQVTGATSALGMPFTMVCWYKLNTTTTFYEQLGCQTQAVATQVATNNNTWDWTGPSVARPAAGSYSIIAIGFGHGGSALASQVNTNIQY